MNLYKSKKFFGMKIKKLKILSLSKTKSFSQQNFFSKNKTPNKIPFLLKKIPNEENSHYIQKNPIKNKLLSIIKQKKSQKSFLNLSRYLNDESYISNINHNKNINSKLEMKKKSNIRNREELKFESDSDSILLDDTPANNFFRNIRDKSLYKYQNVEDDSSFFKKDIFKKKFHKNASNNTSFKNMINNNKINLKKIIEHYINKKENNSSEFIKTKLNIISTKHRQKEIKEYDYYNENNKFNIKYEKPKIVDFGDKNYELFNKIFKKRPKKHSRKFSKSLFDIQFENEKNEPIKEGETRNILLDKIYFNRDYLNDLFKVEKSNKKKIIDEELIDSFNKIKNFNDNEEFILKKIKRKYNSKSSKHKSFSNPTNNKYKDKFKKNF